MSIKIELKIECSCGKVTQQSIVEKEGIRSITDNVDDSAIFKAKQTSPDETTIKCECGDELELYI